MFSWYCSSHSAAPPPSPPLLNSPISSLAMVDEVTGGEHVYVGYDTLLQWRAPEGLQPPAVMGGGGGGLLHM